MFHTYEMTHRDRDVRDWPKTSAPDYFLAVFEATE